MRGGFNNAAILYCLCDENCHIQGTGSAAKVIAVDEGAGYCYY